ncbi:MAG: HAD family hydrolase [Ruminococcaceae bacterium]|nr:HAD family hydrolase [Oscillospiraceae bacterium]
MSIKMILFDLDGTLLPMDQNTFVKAYFGGLAKRLAPYGYDSEKLIAAIWKGTGAMVKNDGSKTNEAVFWDAFANIFGESVRADEPKFDAFYREDFDKVSVSCGYDKRAKETVDAIKARGFRVALATNPIFPSIATEKRMAWAGFEPTDFELFTTYENSCYCKPNPLYYRAVVDALNIDPEDCLMVGNDVDEDMIAQKLGMKVFLLTDCLINKEEKDISVYPHGNFDALLEYVNTLK